MIKLCYKEYPYKFNLDACKKFFDDTGQDLHHVMIKYLNVNQKYIGSSYLDRMEDLMSVADFLTVSKLLHCVIQQENNSIPLAEIQDAMYRVGFLPSESDNEMCQPWPFVMVKLANDLYTYYGQLDKKKAGT